VSARAAVLLATVMCAACARGGGEGRSDTAGSGQGAAGGDTTMPALPESTASQPASAGATPSAPSKAQSGRSSGGAPPGTPAPARRGTPPTATTDTARGIAAVVGAVPITEVVLRQPSGRAITVTGPLAREIGVASGADVWVRGRRVNERTIDVESYAVRSVDGVTAITGTLTAEGDRLVLVTDDGRRHPIARPPAPLREHVGARVWIAGDLGSAINAYGVLRPRR